MKAIALHGSPIKGGNSDTLVEHFFKGLHAEGDHEVLHFYANELDIKPCQGCLECNKPPDYRCVIEDDMQLIYAASGDADIVVFSTPMYWGYMTAQLKTVVDRMEAIASEKYFKGKAIVLVATYWHHVESTVAFFNRVFPFFGGEVHVITYCSLDKENQKDVPASSCEEKLAEAYELGKALGKRTRS